MKHIYLLLQILLISACSASVALNDGNENAVHKIYCSGSTYDWESCHENAKMICNDKGYEVLEKYEDQGSFAAYGSSQVLPDRRLTIQCKQ
jgi:hypothetical protein